MPPVKSELPVSAQVTVQLVEKLGFNDWQFEYEYPTPTDVRRRVQVRDDKHYAPAEAITTMVAAMKRGDDIPPIVVTEDGYIVDGNTRVRAAQRAEFPHTRAIVLNEKWEGASEGVRRRLTVLGAGANARNGRGIDRDEIRNAVLVIAPGQNYTATRIAALMGVTERMVNDVLAEHRARERAEKAGIHVNGSLPASQLRRLGGASDKLNTAPYVELVKLTQDAGLTVSELSGLIAKVRGADSDEAALKLLADERAARREQIQEFTASQKARPSEAAKLRQRLGFILDFEANPVRLVERSPNFGRQHLDVVAKAIEILERVRDEQVGALNAE
jgi:hypothetical protein